VSNMLRPRVALVLDDVWPVVEHLVATFDDWWEHGDEIHEVIENNPGWTLDMVVLGIVATNGAQMIYDSLVEDEIIPPMPVTP
jgi:hypothetical protein